METKMSGSVRDIVNYTAGTDARETVIDVKTGAKIRIDIDGLEGATEQDEPFYIEHGDNLYDAYNRKEAMTILSNIRKGWKYPDMPASFNKPTPKRKSVPKKRKSTKRPSSSANMQGMRGLR